MEEIEKCIKENRPVWLYDPLASSLIAINERFLSERIATVKTLMNEAHNNYICLLCESHLREPFLERLYAMKGLVI